MAHQIHRRVETTIVMPTKLVVCGAQKWISWKLICLPGTQLLTNVMLLLENISTIATEEVVEKLFLKLTEMEWAQEANTESTLKMSSMLKSISTNQVIDFPQLL